MLYQFMIIWFIVKLNQYFKLLLLPLCDALLVVKRGVFYSLRSTSPRLYLELKTFPK